jgi:pyruvate formate lyase activating enzyme
MDSALIYRVTPQALDDGPGIRTAVHFAGCPLRCAWCNAPEGLIEQPMPTFEQGRCQSCGACSEACPHDAIDTAAWPAVDRERCQGCYACVEACPHEALGKLGVPLKEIVEAAAICRDMPFWRVSGGGVSLCGGEPTLHMGAAGKLARKLQKRGAHVLLQTCGHFDLAEYDELLGPGVDTVFFDLKLMNGEDHERWCGVGNQRILENFVLLARRMHKTGLDLVPRIPLIPGVTSTPANLRALAGFLKSQRMPRVALLLYDHGWSQRLRGLGMEPPEGPFMDTPWMTRMELWVCRGYFRGIEMVRPDGRSVIRKEVTLGGLL